MAFTKVAPAGIGSTPGDGYRIGDSFLHSTGVEITNINATGIITATSLDISGDIDVDGHTNLDNVSVAGVTTFTGNTNLSSELRANGNIRMTNVGPKITFVDSNNDSDYEIGNADGVFRIRDTTNSANRFTIDSSGKLTHTQTGGESIDFGTTNANGAYHKYDLSASGATTGYIGAGNQLVVGGTVADFAFRSQANMLFSTGGDTERLRITSDGFVGINEDNPKTGLTIAKLGDYSANDGNTYYMPVGKWSSAWNDIDGIDNSTDYWVGFVGGYLKTSSSVNISLAPNRSNTGQQAGMYISGEATGNSSADFTVGKIIGGSSTGSGTSGNVRATKSELFRITSNGKVGINTAVPRAVLDIEGHAENATLFLHSNDANANLGFSDNTGGARILNYGGDLAFRTGANAHAFGTNDSEKLRIEDNGSVGIGTDDASWGLSGNGGLVVGSGTGSQAITIFCASNADLSFGNAKSGTARYRGLIRYNHGSDYMAFRTASDERLVIDSNGNVRIGDQNNAGNTLRYFDVYNTNTGGSAGAIVRLLTTYSNGSGVVGLDIVKYKAGGAYIINNENVGADTGFIAFNTASSGTSPATHLKVAGNGEVIVSPRNGGASNNRTSIHFNNSAHSPFISFKSNNVTEAAYIRINESNGGANFNFQTKNTSGTLLSRLTLKHNGEFATHQLAGSEKAYPLLMGTGTVANNTNMSGSINMHDINGCHNTSNSNYSIGGWVFLGNDQAAAPYPVRRFKIFKPGAFSNGTIVYQVWHDGDSNYFYGGLWEIRLNLWTDGDIEGVSLRCVNGYRDDLRVFAYNDDNGIMVQPSSIWGRCFIRRFGWDDNGRNPGSSYCAVANDGALATYNSQGTDDGTIPTSGSPVELYPFDGTSGSAGATHTGGYNIENATYFDG